MAGACESRRSNLFLIREEVVCEQRLLTVDRQMGLNIVHPEGKVRKPASCTALLLIMAPQPAKTIFTRMHYDACTDTSVLHCACPHFRGYLHLM